MKVAIMGYGTIGSGVAEVLEVNRDVIAKRCQEPLELKYVLDLRDFAGDPIADKVVHDYKVIAEDPEVAIVVETMGGVEPAYTFVKAMLEKGKHVATSNKALVADRGAELIEIARAHKVNFLFGASVGGGIPIIRPLQSCLTGDVIERITGIINGTTNYMMTKMTREGSDFDEVLADAQDKGYAEKDPTADIEGYDACRKIAILTSLVCGKQVDYQDIPTEGISHITATDIRYANAMGRAIKLLADSKRAGIPTRCVWRRSCFCRIIRCTMWTAYSTRFSSMATCWETVCSTAAARANFPRPALWWRIWWTWQSISTRIFTCAGIRRR